MSPQRNAGFKRGPVVLFLKNLSVRGWGGGGDTNVSVQYFPHNALIYLVKQVHLLKVAGTPSALRHTSYLGFCFFCLFYVENRWEEHAEYWNRRVKGRRAGALGPKGAVDP